MCRRTPPGVVGDDDVGDLPPPALLQGDDDLVGPKGTAVDLNGPLGQGTHLIDDELERPLDLEPADQRAGEHVARPGGRHRNVGEAEQSVGMVVPDVTRHFAGPRRHTDEPEVEALLACHDPDTLEPRLHRGVLEHQVSNRFQLGGQRLQASSASPPPWPEGMSNSVPPGRIRPRP